LRTPEPGEIINYVAIEENSIGQLIIFLLSVMSRSTPIAHRPSGYNGSSLPPHSGGGGTDAVDAVATACPNYGQRLRRARWALAVFMAPILMLFLSFTAVYLIRRGFVSFDVSQRHLYPDVDSRAPSLDSSIREFNCFFSSAASLSNWHAAHHPRSRAGRP